MRARFPVIAIAVLSLPFLASDVKADFCPSPGPPCPCCDQPTEGDPVDIGGGNTLYRVTDVSIPTASGPLSFTRTYTSRAHSNVFTIEVSNTNIAPPFPFGAADGWNNTRWMHNWWSTITSVYGTTYVHNTNGSVDSFYCPATPGFCSYSNADSRALLERTTTGFVYYDDGVGRLVYDKRWMDDAPYEVYFLSEVWGLDHRLATLTYAQPADPSCPVAPTGSATGLPYISKILSDDGSGFSLSYIPTSSRGRAECSLGTVSVHSPGTAGTDTPAVTYGLLSGYDFAHLTSVTTLGAGGGGTDLLEQYTYSGSNQSAIQVVRGGSIVFGHLDPTFLQAVTSIVQPQGRIDFNYYPDPIPGMVHPRIVAFPDSQPGTGVLGPIDAGVLTRTSDVDNKFYGSKYVTQVDTCAPGASCSPGRKDYVWAPNAGDVHEYQQGVSDKRGSWTVQLRGAAPSGQAIQLSELTWSFKGALDADGGTPIDQTSFGYQYSAKGEQQLKSVFRDSVLGVAGSKSETQHSYDPTTNRLTKTIQHGWTSTFSGSTWSTAERYVGTFYFTNHSCLGDAADPLGRVVEVHGPCLVSGFNATNCDGGGAVPITQTFYWPLTESTARAGRVQNTVRFTNNVGLSCATAANLTTTYSAYDARGNATSVTDPNGVVTTFAYEEDRVASSTTSGLTTVYTYDARRLASVKHPQGNYEISCYRTGTPGVGCSGGTSTDKLQWKAKSGVADGSTWSEKAVYTYWPDGTLATETYRGACTSGCTAVSGEIRRVLKHAADAHRRPTWDQVGDASGSYTSARFFDRADNLAGIGFSYNASPAFCGGAAGTTGSLPDTPLSHLCSALGYDRANRLIGVDEYPTSGGSTTRSCLAYDAQDNVASVRTGCSATGTPGDCSGCTSPASAYQYDDFGNVTAATLPWTDNGSGAAGTTRYSYDASGHLLYKQTPAMAQTGDYILYAYDSVGRTLSLTHHYTQPSAGNELLYTFAYDSAATLDASCPQPSNTKGRMLYRNDSFGTTWFRYDTLGRLLQEVRLRTGTTTCSASTPNLNPHTTYTYSNNGNLTSVVYPYGRTVTYGYGSGALADRVSTISVTSWNGTAWVTQSNLISAVAWEPYGGLRGYQIKHPTTSTTSAVEYLLGDNGANTPSPACPTSVPSTASSDHTARIRALWVSTGNFSPGTGNGATYKRTYTWKGDQLKQEDTCLLGATTASTVSYAYDQLLRVTSATRPAGNFSAAGGSIGSRTYGLNGRGNRTSETREDCSYPPTYGQSAFPDRLTRQASSCTGAILKYDYVYDRDGRVSSKTWPVDSSGNAGTTMLFASGGTASGTNGALDSVFKSVSVNGAVYNYYYDALNRRRLKVYPAGPKDEAFHDTTNQLLVDQGNDAVLSPTAFPVDEYVWLGGRPVVLVRSKLSTTWTRQTDSTGDCTRNGDAAVCGFYFPVTDPIGKPVVMLDASRRLSGAAEYDVFGFPNRVSLDKETAHPYANNSNLTVADFTQAIGGTANPSTQIRVRAIFDVIDTEGPAATPADYVFLKDPDGGAALTSNIGGPHRGQVWSPWVIPSAGRVQVPFISNGSGNAYTGVVMAGYEYQRFQSAAQPFWTPLSFPGQYHDAETDLFQNWNRFYDATTGRYLEGDPLLDGRNEVPGNVLKEASSPRTFEEQMAWFDSQRSDVRQHLAQRGMSRLMASPEGRSVLSEYRPDLVARWMIGPAYTYAEANPTFNIDPTGLTSKEGETCYWACAGAFAATESSAAGLCTFTGPGWGACMVAAQPVCLGAVAFCFDHCYAKEKNRCAGGAGGGGGGGAPPKGCKK